MPCEEARSSPGRRAPPGGVTLHQNQPSPRPATPQSPPAGRKRQGFAQLPSAQWARRAARKRREERSSAGALFFGGPIINGEHWTDTDWRDLASWSAGAGAQRLGRAVKVVVDINSPTCLAPVQDGIPS
ncbi:hypothetical protein IMZ48_11365 [Candidatus Bathyarchaeota archaeon]|nr:hypothetical protein [Candidatus Bathyarchaeota archaeon]